MKTLSVIPPAGQPQGSQTSYMLTQGSQDICSKQERTGKKLFFFIA